MASKPEHGRPAEAPAAALGCAVSVPGSAPGSRSLEGDRLMPWASVEGAFFAKGVEDDLAAIEQYEAMGNKASLRLDLPAWRRGALVLAVCAVGVLGAASVGVLRQARRPAQASTSDLRAGAPVAEAMGVTSPSLMSSPPSSQTETQVPSVAGALAREPLLAMFDAAIVRAQTENPKPGVEALAHAQANEPVSQCRSNLEKHQTSAIPVTCAEAIDLDATLAKPLLAWALSEFQHGRTRGMATWAHRIINVDPTLADAYLILGVAEQDSGRTASARRAYKRYLELSPRGAYAGDVRSALNSM